MKEKAGRLMPTSSSFLIKIFLIFLINSIVTGHTFVDTVYKELLLTAFNYQDQVKQ